MIKVGVIGFGLSAKVFHIPFILSSAHFELVAISSSQAVAVKQAHPTVNLYESADDLITQGDVDLVIITAPNHVHFSLAKLSLEHGCHVIIEKPMVTNAADGEALVKLAKEKSLLLSVYHNRRWDGDFLTVKHLIETQQLGDVRVFESRFDRFRPEVRERWRELPGDGSGIWYDLGPHLVDQAVCLFGLPEKVTASCLSLRDNSQTTDYFKVVLHYAKREVILSSSPFAASPNCRFRVEGDKGSFIKYGSDPQEAQLINGMLLNDPAFGMDDENSYGRLYNATSHTTVSTYKGCYDQYFSQIAQAIESGGSNPVEPDEIVAVIKLLELAQESSDSGKTLSFAH